MKGNYRRQLKIFCLTLLSAGLVSSTQKGKTLIPKGTICQTPESSERLKVIDIEHLTECFEIETISLLRNSLTDGDWQVQVIAAYSLGEIGWPAPHIISDLIELSANEDHRVRYAAITALGKMESTDTISVLSDALNDSNPNIHASAAISLIKRITELDLLQLESFRSELEKDILRYRIRRTDDIIFTGNEEKDFQVHTLIRALEHKHWLVRYTAAQTLETIFREDDKLLEGWASYQTPISLVQGLLYDIFFELGEEKDITDTFISGNAQRALGFIRYNRSIPALVRSLSNNPNNESTAFALGLLEAREAAPILTSRLETVTNLEIPNSQALWQTGAAESIPFLINYLEHSTDFREGFHPVVSLAYFESDEAASALVRAFRSENLAAHWRALNAFAEVPYEDSTEALMRARSEIFPDLLEIINDENLNGLESRIISDGQRLDIPVQGEMSNLNSYVASYVDLLIEALNNMGEDCFPEIIERISPATGIPSFYHFNIIEPNPHLNGKPRYFYREYSQSNRYDTLKLRRLYLEEVGQRIDTSNLVDQLRSSYSDAVGTNDEDTETLIRLLGALKSEESVGLLTELLRDEAYSSLSKKALDYISSAEDNALEETDYENAIATHRQFLQDEDLDLVYTSSFALAEIGEQSIPALIEILSSKKEYSNNVRKALADYDSHIKWSIVAAIGEHRLMNLEIVQALLEVATDETSHKSLKSLTAETLEKIDVEKTSLSTEALAPPKLRRECFDIYGDYNSNKRLSYKRIYEYDLYLQTCFSSIDSDPGFDPWEAVYRRIKRWF